MTVKYWNICNMKKFLAITILFFLAATQNIKAETIPNLIGTWSGENNTFSELKGMKTWEKNVQITEQNDRRFKGLFTYSDGTKNFYGIIHPDNPLIRDLIIEGLSLARTQKEEFNSVIQSNDGDINALFANLTEFINK